MLTLFIGIELASAPMFLLSGWKKGDQKSNEGAIKFFLLGVLSASLILYGFSLLYGLTGELIFSEISKILLVNNLSTSPAALLSVMLILAGIGFKISVSPQIQKQVDSLNKRACIISTFYFRIICNYSFLF